MRLRILTLLLCFGLAGSAFGQGLPSKKEIDAKVQEGLKSLPDKEESLEGVCTFTYKEVPSSPESIVKMAAGRQLPPGVDPKMAMGMYLPVISAAFQRNLQVAGKLKVEKSFKIGSKKIPVGEHKFGYLFKGMQITTVLIYQKGKKKPIKLAIKSKVNKGQYHEKLQLKLEQDKKRKTKFTLGLVFYTQTSKSKQMTASK